MEQDVTRWFLPQHLEELVELPHQLTSTNIIGIQSKKTFKKGTNKRMEHCLRFNLAETA